MADEMAVQTEPEAVIDIAEEAKKERIDLTCTVTDAGPCKKHVHVVVPRAEIDKFYDKEFSDLVKTAAVPGFRPGKTPRRLIERKFRKNLGGQVKSALLMQTLEQIGEESKLDPLTEPQIDFEKIELPDTGDFVYEFDVEVRPDFGLPDYKGLRIEKPVKEMTEVDVEAGLQKFLRTFGSLKVKEGQAADGDYVVVDIRFVDDGNVLRELSQATLQVQENLILRDGRIEGFGAAMIGAQAGDSRELKAIIAEGATDAQMRGKQVDAIFVVTEVMMLQVPMVDRDFLNRLDMGDEGELRDVIRAMLNRQMEYRQKQSAREQIALALVEKAQFELPQDLLKRQTVSTMRRKAMELEQSGMTEDDIRKQLLREQQNLLGTTAAVLKLQFVLQKIAEAEELKVETEDLEKELNEMAASSGESVRKVRSRIEKEGLWESVALKVLEDKTLDRILTAANIVDVPYEEKAQQSAEALDEAALPDSEEPEAAVAEGDKPADKA